MVEKFNPPFGLGHAHVQTLISSSFRKLVAPRSGLSVTQVEQLKVIDVCDGARLTAWVSEQPLPAPLIVIIHGWLGNHNSGYSLSLAEKLWSAGFSIARLNLRDHGDTSHLNETMFHNGLIEEAVDAVRQLTGTRSAAGLVGFSLGGNFALRIAKHLCLPTLAICPLLDPAQSIEAVDDGWVGYRLYFMRKWFNALREKQLAFPHLYDFASTGAFDLTTVRSMTEHFVEQFSPYDSLQEYYDLYTLTGDWLDGVDATILAAADDPVVPTIACEQLSDSILVDVMDRGGHCAFIDSYRMTSYADDYALRYFSSLLDQ